MKTDPTHPPESISTGPFFVFDVESVGLHGQAFAVAGGVSLDGILHDEFCFACHPDHCASGAEGDREWVNENIPHIPTTHLRPGVLTAFHEQWVAAQAKYPGIKMAAECGWPVEAGFLRDVIHQDIEVRNWSGPYPLHEIASFMVAAGIDPMAAWLRLPSEMPSHDPLNDARLSARILHTSINLIHNKNR